MIQENIKKDLAEELLFGSLTDGGTAFIDLFKNKLKIKIESNNKNNVNKKVETVKTSVSFFISLLIYKNIKKNNNKLINNYT